MVKTVAIAGAGDVAKYVVEELTRKGHKVVILSRAYRDWFVERNIEIRVTDYSAQSLTPLLKDVDVLISLLHDNGPFYNDAHLAMIAACNASDRCKRFIPSECGGNIEDFREHPLFYVPTHGAIREVLAAQTTLEYTLFNIGWFMDYFIPGKTYMKPLPGVWPLDIENRTLRLLGSGNEPVTFTAARDAGRALAHLVDVPKWELYTNIAGETTTWNKILHKMEQCYNTSFTITQRTTQEIEESKVVNRNGDVAKLWLDYMDLWNALGAAGLPEEKSERQRQEIFGGMKFMSVDDILDKAASSDSII